MKTKQIAEVIAEQMATIREDVAHGNGAVIEADAVLVGVAYGIAAKLGMTHEEQIAFMTACDLDNLIPEEAFQR